MSEVFGEAYARFYDDVYAGKDYERECEVVVRLVDEHGRSGLRSFLDLGCGTGNHSLVLARRGFEVVGVDRSAAMLAIANAKAKEERVQVTFELGDMRTLQVGRKFGAVLAMFAVLGYQTENDDLVASLQAVRTHLDVGGLFIFDVWYGPAVVTRGPELRFQEMDQPGRRILRVSDGVLDHRRHVCEVRMHVLELSGREVSAETKEAHEMRYFFPQELALVCRMADLDLVLLNDFGDPGRPADVGTWSVIGVARAV